MQIPSEMVPLLMKLIDTETVFLADILIWGIGAIVVIFSAFAWSIHRELKAMRMLIAGALQARTDEERRTLGMLHASKMND